MALQHDTSPRPEVVVVGSVNRDLTCYLHRWPAVGETVAAYDTRFGTGGKGANQAATAARMGSATLFIGAIGDDAFGRAAEASLSDIGVSLALRRVEDMTTGLAFIDLGPNSGNIIRIAGGANAGLDADCIAVNSAVIRAAKVLLLQNETAVTTALIAALHAREGGAVVIMDPAPAPQPMWSDDVFGHFDIVTPNATEAGIITGVTPTNLTEALSAAHILAKLTRLGAIVTMGEKGVAWVLEDSEGTMTCPIVTAIDTVAAGDCFNGAFAAALAQNMLYPDAIAFAVHAAALATAKKGAIDSLPLRDDVMQSLSQTLLA
jgi:ribokinase